MKRHKILGMCFDANMKFKSHFEFGEHGLIPKLQKKKGALKFLHKRMTLKQKRSWPMGSL